MLPPVHFSLQCSTMYDTWILGHHLLKRLVITAHVKRLCGPLLRPAISMQLDSSIIWTPPQAPQPHCRVLQNQMQTFMEILLRWNYSLAMQEHCSTASMTAAQCHRTLVSWCFLSWDSMWNKVVHFVSSHRHRNHNTIPWRDMGVSSEQQPRSSLELTKAKCLSKLYN